MEGIGGGGLAAIPPSGSRDGLAVMATALWRDDLSHREPQELGPEKLPRHPLSSQSGHMDGRVYAALIDSIAGSPDPPEVVVYQGQVLDSSYVLNACEAAGVVPVLLDYIGDDPLVHQVRHGRTGVKTAVERDHPQDGITRDRFQNST